MRTQVTAICHPTSPGRSWRAREGCSLFFAAQTWSSRPPRELRWRWRSEPGRTAAPASRGHRGRAPQPALAANAPPLDAPLLRRMHSVLYGPGELKGCSRSVWKTASTSSRSASTRASGGRRTRRGGRGARPRQRRPPRLGDTRSAARSIPVAVRILTRHPRPPACLRTSPGSLRTGTPGVDR